MIITIKIVTVDCEYMKIIQKSRTCEMRIRKVNMEAIFAVRASQNAAQLVKILSDTSHQNV